jgi:hypothetical protein
MTSSRRKGLIVVLLLISFTTDWIVEGFLVTSTTSNSNFNGAKITSNYQLRSLYHRRVFTPTLSSSSSARLRATKEDDHLTEEDTWSRSGSGDEKSSSRFGVRKRVRAVLEKAKNRTGIRNVNSQEVDDLNDNNDNSNEKLYSIGGFDGDPNLVSSVTSTTIGASTKINGASTNGSVVPSNGASTNGSVAPVNGASTNGSVAPVNGASTNGSVAPVNGVSINGSAAPVNGAAIDGSVEPVNGAFCGASGSTTAITTTAATSSKPVDGQQRPRIGIFPQKEEEGK